MDKDKKKVYFGIKKCYIAPVIKITDEGVPTFGKPVAVPGAVSLKLSPQGDTTKKYADDVTFWTGVSNQGYTGVLELMLLSDEVKTTILNYVKDGKGVLYEDSQAQPKKFALLFEANTDAKPMRYVFYNCIATRPEEEHKTVEEKIDPGTMSIDIEIAQIYIKDLDIWTAHTVTTDETDETVYKNWYSVVYMPTKGIGG